MTLRAVYLAAPLALGLACSHSSGAKTQGTASTGTTGASGSASASTATGTAMGAHTVMGRVSQASSDQLVIETMDGRQETLSLQNQTAITLDGQVARASDLQPGQMVRASYDEQAGQKNAVSIQAGHHGMDSSGSMGGVSGGGSTVQGSGAAGQAGDTGVSGDRGSYQSPGATGSGSGSTGAGDTSSSGTPSSTTPDTSSPSTGSGSSSDSSSGSSTSGKW